MTVRPLVLLTQRVDVVPRYGERRDALDQAWVTLLAGLGCDVALAPNNAAAAEAGARRLGPVLVILTGGNGVLRDQVGYAPERNETEEALLEWSRAERVPVLGVCRGFQFMNMHLGGRLSALAGHVASDHATSVAKGPFAVVNSFHEYGIAPGDLAAALTPLATAPDGSIEAARHRQLPWIGIMWHPERQMPDAPGAQRWFAGLIGDAARDGRIQFA